MTTKQERCTLRDTNIMQCCCNCIEHRPVHYHCGTLPKPEGVFGCVCGIRKGWACAVAEHGRIFDNWPEHSCGCELYCPRS